MQCVRCGKVLNLEDRRCPKCLASLTNLQISQMEVTRQQLHEIADIERSAMTTSLAKKGAATGAALGALGMVIALNPIVIVVGMLAGGVVGWVVAWRRWGQYRSFLLFSVIMLPVVVPVTMSPFAVLATLATGMLIGLAIELNR